MNPHDGFGRYFPRPPLAGRHANWGYNLYGNWGNGNTYRTNDTWRYETGNPEFSFSAHPTAFMSRFNRGDRYMYDAYCSFVLPLDLEQGVQLDAAGNDLYSYGLTAPWFLKVQKTQRQHAWQLITGTTNMTRFAVDNPVAAYGSEAGGSPLYTGQSYRFGFHSGLYDEKTGQTNMIRILVYDRATLASGATNVAPTNIIIIPLPRRYIAADSNVWSNFITNGEKVVVETNGLRTAVEFADGQNSYNDWGLGWQFAVEPQVVLGGYRVTHQATSTNYYYVVESLGSVEVGVNVMTPMAVTNTSTAAYLPMYAMNFEGLPPWRANFIDNPHFEGIPLPPAYAGRRAKELNGLTAVVTNAIWLTNNTAFTNLDATPELRRHPILDQFVEDMGRNPLALASYVINEIELTDPMGLQESSKQVADSIEVGGVNRSALGVFLEGQGSPTEQCALLVYLLRQAGYSAGYVFPTNGNLRLLDTRLSQLWQMNVHGVIYYSGVPVITNSLIMVNYPWVVANIGTNTVQIFPWLKDTEIVEGQNIYNYLPTNYFSAYDWIKDYALASPALMALGSPQESVARIWKKYLTNLLNTNQLQSNLSLDDFGVRAFNRRDSYPTWSSLPLPNYLTNQSQVAVVPTLTESAVTYPFLTNMFDRLRIEIFKNDTNTANRIIDTGLWRSCDLHNRKFLLYTNAPNTVSLWLASYRSSITNTTNFANIDTGSNSLYFQIVQTNVGATVSNLPVRITLQRRDSTYASPTTWYPLQEQVSAVYPTLMCNTRDVTAIIPGIARATPAMLRVYAEDYWNLQRQKAANTNYVPAVTDDAGTSAMMMGLSFFEKMWDEDKFNQSIHKVHSLTWNSFGTAAFTRLTNSMVAKLNMQWFYNLLLGNATIRQDSGDRGANTLNNYLSMLQANGSSAEHAVLASLWGSTNSASSVRLLQLAAQRGRSNSWALPLELNVNNYKTLGSQSYTGYGTNLLMRQDTNLWNIVTNAFGTQWDANYLRVLITPGPVTNADNTFKGMASLIFGKYSTGAIMSDNQTVLNGGSAWQVFSFDSFSSFTPSYDLSYNLQYTPVYDYSFGSPNFGYSFGGPTSRCNPSITPARRIFRATRTRRSPIISPTPRAATFPNWPMPPDAGCA